MSNLPLLPLAADTWGDEEIDAISDVLLSRQFTMGKKVEEFEKKFSQMMGAKYAVMASSGSAANLLMTAALFFKKTNPLRPGDEIIVPAVSWSTTYYPLHQYGLKLKFVDICELTLNYDLQALQGAISASTRAIMVVNLLGNPNDFKSLDKIINGQEIYLIEDNCESMGATFNGKFAGTFGLMGSFSTYFSHHISTMEGGVVLTSDEELYHILLCLRAHGWTRNLPKVNHVSGLKSEDPFEESFKFILPGFNCRPIEFEAAVGLKQLDRLDGFVKTRRENADCFKEIFLNNEFLQIQREIGESSWFGFGLVLKRGSSLSRNSLVSFLKQAGIDTRPIVAGNFLRQPVASLLNYSKHNEMYNADLIHENGFFIGNHHFSIKNELCEFEKILKKGIQQQWDLQKLRS